MSDKGIERRTTADGRERFRAHVKCGYTKVRSPWTDSLEEALIARGVLTVAAEGAWADQRRLGTERAVRSLPPAEPSVYFIQAGPGGPIKIGYTRAAAALRVGAMQTHNHEELVLLGSVPAPQAYERELHRRLAEHHIRGEWYAPHEDVLQAIRGTPVGLSHPEVGRE